MVAQSNTHVARCSMWACGWEATCDDKEAAEIIAVAHVIMVHPEAYEAVTGKRAVGDAVRQAREALARG